MAVKFRRSNDSVASIGASPLTCVLDVSYDEQGNVLVSDCDDANAKKEQVLGGITRTGTLTAEVNDTDEAQLELIDPGSTGAWIDRPFGAYCVEWTATAVTVASRRYASSRSNLTTYEIGLIFSGLDHSTIV
jgi:hypothetical protein